MKVTKDQLCKAILADYMVRNMNAKEPCNFKDIPKSVIYLEPKVAIAMNQLGLLTDKDDIEYASSCKYVMYSPKNINNGESTDHIYLSDIINSLPD